MIIKFVKKKLNLIKICAVFTAVCFVVSTLGSNLYAIAVPENTTQKYEDVFNKVSSISAEYGKITSSKDAQSDITVINIQDLHCHPQTQRNISKIIAQLADKYNLKKIYVEGGYGDIDVSWLNSVKDEGIRKQVIEKLLEDGILTGSEYYKLTSNDDKVELKGIDEEQIHKDNVRRLSWIIENQDKYKNVMTKVGNEINILEKMYVNGRNERFNRDIKKYLTNETDSKRFYRQLLKYVKDINANPDKYNNITSIRLEDYPNISKFMTLRKVSKNINVRDVTQQLQTVINELKNKLPYNTYTRLLKETENFSDSQKVVELITSLCKKEGIDLDNRYKALSEFLKSNEINKDLNAVKLVYEERELITEIRKALSYNNEEYEITFVSDFSRYFQDYLEYKLTDADWKYFESGYEQFRQLYGKYAAVDRISEIEDDFDEINKYYEINDQRNNIFVENLLKDEEINLTTDNKLRLDEEILKNSKEIIIAITGGFHSSELEEILAENNVNTIVITPSIFEGIEKATKQYKGLIKEQSKQFQHQALAYTLASCTTDAYQKNLLYTIAKDILGGNVEKLKEVFGENIDLTVFDNLQPLTEQEQEKANQTIKPLNVAANIITDFLPKKGFESVFYPDMDEIILGISKKFVENGIFFSKGEIFEIEEIGSPELHGIPAEVYSRMYDVIQKYLFDSSLSSEEKISAQKKRKGKRERVIETKPFSPEQQKQSLMELVQNNTYSYKKLADIVEEYKIDTNKETKLLSELAANIHYSKEILGNIINFAREHDINTDFRYKILFEYIDIFEKLQTLEFLFSLDDDNIQFLDDLYYENRMKDSVDNSTELEILLSDIENLNEILNGFRILYLDKFNLSLSSLDISKFTIFIEQFHKIKNLSKQDLQELVLLDYKVIDSILTSVSTDKEITKIFEYAHKFNLSSKILRINIAAREFQDVRYKAVIQYIDLEDEKLFDKLFSLDNQTLQVIVDSIPDSKFIKEYLLNEDKYLGNKTYFEVYTEFLANIKGLNLKKVAVENNYLALKLLVDDGFNNIISSLGIEYLTDSDNIISKYFAAIFASRFIYDSLGYEVFNYDISLQSFQNRLKQIMGIYVELLNEMTGISIFGKKTKIYALCNNEIFSDGSRRFGVGVFYEILNYFQDVPDITNFDRAENENANSDWLDSFRKFGLDSDDPMNEKGYFVFMGHGGTIHLQSVSPKRDKIFRGKIIKADLSSQSEFITVEDLAEALFDLAVRDYKKVDLRNITIDLSSCHSYEFARKVYDLLDEKYREYAQSHEDFEGTYPTIITATGLETELTYTVFTQNINDFHDAVINTLKSGKIAEYTLDMLAMSEFQIHESNITMFTSYRNEDFKRDVETVRKSVRDLFEADKQTGTDVKEKALEKAPPLPGDVLEASILRPLGVKAADYAHIWEEGLFRYLPTALILSRHITPLAGLGIQLVFVLAHPIVKWMSSRAKWKAAKKKGEDVGKKEDIGDLFKRIGHDIKNLGLPTLVMMLPYIGSLLTLAISPVLSILITPVLITFADVIVQWITRKDSGGKITINRNLVIVSLVASLVAYTALPFIPVVGPLVNALINPVIITNTIGAGYLHYTYNEKQKDSDKLLKIIDIRERTRNYLKGIKIDESVKNRIQRLCNENNIDLSENELLQEFLFTRELWRYGDLINPLFEIKIDGKNSELKKKILTKYFTESYYTISDESEFSLLKDLINADNEIILNYLLNHSVKEFLEDLFLYEINDFSTGDESCLDKMEYVISSTGGKISVENLLWSIIDYTKYKQNIDEFVDKNDKNYNLKCAILAKYIKEDLISQSNKDTIEWLFANNHKGLLTYVLYGLDFNSIILDTFLIDDNGNSIYKNKDFDILDKYLQEMEMVFSLGYDSKNNFEILVYYILNKDDSKKIRNLDTETFKALFTLAVSNYSLFSQIIKKVENVEDLKKYVEFINGNADYIKNKKIPMAEIIENTNSIKEIEKYFNLIKEYNLIFDTVEIRDKGTRTSEPLDYRWKIALEYLNIEEDVKGEIFEYLLKTDVEEDLKDRKRYENIYNLFHDFPKDSNFFERYLFNNKNKYKETYKKLLDALIIFKFRGIASENDFLALKLLTDENFNNTLDALVEESKLWDFSETSKMSKEEILVVKYYAAIAVSRFIYDSVGNEIAGYDLSSNEIKQQISVITELYIEAVRQMGQIVLLDSHTKIYGLFNDEIKESSDERGNVTRQERFNEEAIQKMLEILGIVDEMDFQPTFYKVNDYSDASEAAGSWLGEMRELILEKDEENAYFVFRGHGDETDQANRLILKGKTNEVIITAQDMADALFDLATREQDPVDLRRVTIDLSCCYSYFFARKVYSILRQKYRHYVEDEGHKDFKGTFPTIITAAGLETKTALTIPAGQSENEEISQWIGNLHEGMIKVLNGKKEFTLDMLALSEYKFRLSNITMFASFDDDMTKEIERVRKATKDVFKKYSVGTQAEKTEQQTAQEEESQIEQAEQQKVQEGQEKSESKEDTLFGGLMEGSILKPLGLKLADYAHIWEELVFRTAPTLGSVIISSLIISLPFSPFITIPLGIITLGIYYKKVFVPYQEKFINAHIITDWLATKDAGDYTLSDVLKMAILGKFPSEELKQEYEKYYELEKAQIHRNKLKTPTLLLSVPYIITTIAPFAFYLSPLAAGIISIIAATVTAQFLHYKYNKNQQDSYKLLDIGASKKIIFVTERIQNTRGKKLKITDYFGRKNIKVIERGTRKTSRIDYNAEYKIPKKYEIIKPEDCCIWETHDENNNHKKSGKIGFTMILGDEYEFYVSEDETKADMSSYEINGNVLDVELPGTSIRYVWLKKKETNEIVKLEISMSNYKPRLKISNISYVDIDDNLKKDYGLEKIEYFKEGDKQKVTLHFNDGNKETVSLPDDESVVYFKHSDYIFCFKRKYSAPIRIYKIHEIFNDDEETDKTDDKTGDKANKGLELGLKKEILCIEIERGYRTEDFKDRNFVIKRSNNKEYMLYFDSKKGKLYEVKNSNGSYGRTEISPGRMKDYGILKLYFDPVEKEITELVLEEGASIQIDVRQPLEITDENSIFDEMQGLKVLTRYARGKIVTMSRSRFLSLLKKLKNLRKANKKKTAKFISRKVKTRILDDLPPEKLIPILKRACPIFTDKELMEISNGNISKKAKEKLGTYNYQGRIAIDLNKIDFKDINKLRKTLKENPIIYSMFVEALYRTMESLQGKTNFRVNGDTTITEILQAIDNAEIDKDYFETLLRGYFGEIYCTKTIVAGTFKGITLRLQMPDASNEPGIDLIDPVTGMKIQVKTPVEDEEGKASNDIVKEHLEKNWIEKDKDAFIGMGLKKIPVLTVPSVKDNFYRKDSRVQSFDIEGRTIQALIQSLLDYENIDNILDKDIMLNGFVENSEILGGYLSTKLPREFIRIKLEKKHMEKDHGRRTTVFPFSRIVPFENKARASILKPLGLNIDDKPYIWEEALFRYLPTAIMVLKFLVPLASPFTAAIYFTAAFIPIQFLFISLHSVVKWKVARAKWEAAQEKARKEGKDIDIGEKEGVGDLFKRIGHDIKNLGLPTLALMLPYAGSFIALAINPVLSIIITPALITFADVIVQWITKKDSGGEVKINKNLVIVSVIASLAAYIALPLIPVIHPIVNSLINPVVIVNAIGAGYLHYEYNKRQQDSDKWLDIGAETSASEETNEEKEDEEDEEDAENDEGFSLSRVRSIIYTTDSDGNRRIFNLKDFLGRIIILPGQRGRKVIKPVAKVQMRNPKKTEDYFETKPKYTSVYSLQKCDLYDSEGKVFKNVQTIFYSRENEVRIVYGDNKHRALKDGKYTLIKEEGGTKKEFKVEKNVIKEEQESFDKLGKFGKQLTSTNEYILKEGCSCSLCDENGNPIYIYDNEGKQINIKKIRYNSDEQLCEFVGDDGTVIDAPNGTYKLVNRPEKKEEIFVVRNKQILLGKEEETVLERKAFLKKFEISTNDRIERKEEECNLEGHNFYLEGKKMKAVRYMPNTNTKENDGELVFILEDGGNTIEKIIPDDNNLIYSITTGDEEEPIQFKFSAGKLQKIYKQARPVNLNALFSFEEEDCNLEGRDFYLDGKQKIKAIRYITYKSKGNGKLIFILEDGGNTIERIIPDDNNLIYSITTGDEEESIQFKFSAGKLQRIKKGNPVKSNLKSLFANKVDVSNRFKTNTAYTYTLDTTQGKSYFLEDQNSNRFTIKGLHCKNGNKFEFIDKNGKVIRLTGSCKLKKEGEDKDKDILQFDYDGEQVKVKNRARIKENWAQDYASNEQELYYVLKGNCCLSYIEGNEEKNISDVIISYNKNDGSIRFFNAIKTEKIEETGIPVITKAERREEITIPEQCTLKNNDTKETMSLTKQNGKVVIIKEQVVDTTNWLKNFSIDPGKKPRTSVKITYTPKENYKFVVKDGKVEAEFFSGEASKEIILTVGKDGKIEAEFFSDEDHEFELKMIDKKTEEQTGDQIKVHVTYTAPKEKKDETGENKEKTKARRNITVTDQYDRNQQEEFITNLCSELQKIFPDLVGISFSEEDGKLTFKFQNGESKSVEYADNKTGKAYFKRGKYIVSISKALISVYKIVEDAPFININDETLEFSFKASYKRVELQRGKGYDFGDFTDRKFIIEFTTEDNFGNKRQERHMLYFNSKNGKLYEIKNIFKWEEINVKSKNELKKYGIVKFVSKGKKITEFIIEKNTKMRIDIRQPLGTSKDRIQQEAKQLHRSMDTSVPRPVFVLKPKELDKLGLSSIPKDFIETFFENIINDTTDVVTNEEKQKLINDIKVFIDRRVRERISPEKLETIFKQAGISEQEAKMYVESILAEYIYTIVEKLDQKKRREMLLSIYSDDINSLIEQIDVYSSSADKQEFLALEFGLEIDQKELENVKITEQYLIKKLIEQNILQVLTPYQMKRALKRAGLNEKQIGKINFDSNNPLKNAMDQYADIKEKLHKNNYQGLVDINLDDIDFSNEEQLKQIFKEHPIIYSMFIETLYRTMEALKVQGRTNFEIKDTTTIAELLNAIHEAKFDKNFFETQLRGIFGEVYCTKTVVAGRFDGFVFRLQMAESAKEPGIDLINPISGLKLQVKTGLNYEEFYLLIKHFDKNWQEKESLAKEIKRYGPLGHRMISVFTTWPLKFKADEIKNQEEKTAVGKTIVDLRVQSFDIDGETIQSLIGYLLDYDSEGEILTEPVMKKRLSKILSEIDRSSALDFLKLTQSDLQKRLEEKQIKIQNAAMAMPFIDEREKEEARAAILPENMSLVNKIMHSTFGNAFIAATAIAIIEFRASFEPNFVALHQSAAGIAGAQELVDFINKYEKYKIVEIDKYDGILTRILKTILKPILKVLFAGASIVKHIAIDYRYIKASGIQEAIEMFGKDAKLTEDGQIEVAVVEDIEQLQGSFTLVNTGLKVDGASIFRIKDSNLLMYGAKGQQSIKVVKTLNGSDLLNKDIVEMLKANGENADEIQTQATVTRAGEGISISDDIVEIGEMELAGKSPEQVKQFVASAFEIKRVMGIMYGQKTIIDLKTVKDLEKLRATIYNGRARKVISIDQLKNLNLTKEDIENLKKEGIEIYIDLTKEQIDKLSKGEISEEEIKEKIKEIYEETKDIKIAGQIIRDKDGIRIKDYSIEEEIKIKEILKIEDIEREILTSETPVMVGINILTEHFKQGNITAVQREFGALLGKIKMSLNLGELNSNDIEYMGYNINFNRIPVLTQQQIDDLFEKDKDGNYKKDADGKVQIVSTDKLIQIIGPETEFAVILKTIKNTNTETEKRFKEIAVERILAKSSLVENNKEFGLKDKNMEILLGKMLLAQVNNTDKRNTNISDDYKGRMTEVMEMIKEETKKAVQGDEVAINTVIELILTYGDDKGRQMTREADKDDIRNYRAMLAAA